jgi:Asp-tRNA(Asn)/Glu-tRNA(Gln) amidotransferase A subunit family amidase
MRIMHASLWGRVGLSIIGGRGTDATLIAVARAMVAAA